MERFFIIAFIIIIIGSCKKDMPSDICGQNHRFYYYKGQKIYLNEESSKLMITFDSTTTPQQQKNILSQFGLIGNIDTISWVVATFTSFQSCETVFNKINQIRNNPQINTADLILLTQDGYEMGLANQFILKLKSSTTKNDLYQLATETKTHVWKQWQYDSLTYIINVDRYSNGDALDMANWFYETQKFEYSEPNFVYLHLF